MFSCGLFNNAVSIASSGRLFSEMMNWNGSDRKPTFKVLSRHLPSETGEPLKPSNGTVCTSAGTRTNDFSNASQKHHHFTQIPIYRLVMWNRTIQHYCTNSSFRV
jgi:hypothetical protein